MTDAEAQSPADPRMVALGNAVLDAMDFDGSYDRLLPPVRLPNDAIADAAAQALMVFNRKYLGPAQLRPLLADAYATQFTELELRDLIAWYSSPLGQRFETARPSIVAAVRRPATGEQSHTAVDPTALALANALLDAMEFDGAPGQRVAHATIARDVAPTPGSTFRPSEPSPTLRRPAFASALVHLFTEQELRGLVTWHSSLLGKKLAATRRTLSAAGRALTDQVYREHADELRSAESDFTTVTLPSSHAAS